MTSSLHYKLFVTAQIPQSGRGPLPDGSSRMWSPITSTLILGTHDAVLVDPPLTNTQAAEVGDWIEASGRRLHQIYITHGHGDHWFGAIPLQKRFPGVAVRATEGTKQHMAVQNSAEFRADVWDRSFRVNSRRVRSMSTSSTDVVSSSRMFGFSRSKWVTPTPTRRRFTCQRSGCWWPVTSSTTACIYI